MTEQERAIQERFQQVFNRFVDEVNEITQLEVRGWPDGKRMIDIARAMCNSQWPYRDHEEACNRLTVGMPHGHVARDVKGTTALDLYPRPAWYHFLNEARVALQFLGREVTEDKAIDFMQAVREACKK